MKPIWITIFFIAMMFIYGCGGGEKIEEKKEVTTIVKPEVETLESITPLLRERKKYVYGGLSYRDPFLPETGEKMAKAKLGLTKDAIVPSFGTLQIKGIIMDKRDKIGLFTSPTGSYIFANGKLYDNQNRLVPGISGKMLIQDGLVRGVVLVAEDGSFKEFYLPEKPK